MTSSSSPSSQPSELSSSSNYQSSSLLRTALSPATTDHTSLLLFSPNSPSSNKLSHPKSKFISNQSHHDQISSLPSDLSSNSNQTIIKEEEETNHQLDQMSSTQFSSSSSHSNSFNSLNHDQSIEHLLSSLGYSSNPQNQNLSQSRNPIRMQDIDGQTFSIHEHSLSPVSEHTELDTSSSSKTSHSKKKLPLVQSVLAHRFHLENSIHPITPLKLYSPQQKINQTLETSPPAPSQIQPNSFATYPSKSTRSDSLHSPHLLSLPNSSTTPFRIRPSLHRIPKKTSQLIQLFENTNSSSPSNLSRPSSPQRNSRSSAHISPPNPVHSLPNSNSSLNSSSPDASQNTHPLARNTTQNSLSAPSLRNFSQPLAPGTPPSSAPLSPSNDSVQSSSSLAIPEPTMTEKEFIKARHERRERIAMATKNNSPYSSLRPPSIVQPSMLEPPSPMSDQYLKHRKSVASSITSKISDVQVLHSGLIWYRNPQTQQWKETRGILTTEAVYLMNENGHVDMNLPDQSIELNLRGCISVESVRSKRSYGPNSTEPHLHILRISWAEFDHQSNSRSEYEEFLGCSRATQRADWVGAIWQAAHDLGGFVDQPDIPLRRGVSPTSVQPSSHLNKLSLPDSTNSNVAPSTPSIPESSPRLDPISLVDRALSIDPVPPRESSPVPTASQISHSNHFSSQLEPPMSSFVNSRTSESDSITTNLQSELDRELLDVQKTLNSSVPTSTRHLYSEETLKEIDNVDLALRSYPIDPNLRGKPTRAPSPEIDIFAMLDRMSVSGSIHRNTAQFYDPPQFQESQDPQGILPSQQDVVPRHTDNLILDPNDRRRSPSQHSYHTIRATSAAGIHDQHVDSPRSSALGLRSIEREHLSEVVSPVNLNRTSSPNPSVFSFTKSPVSPNSSTISKGSSHKGNSLEPPSAVRRARGAWSDTDRLSNQTDHVLLASNPARAVQRDLRRILKTIERNDSHRLTQSKSIGNNLDSIQNQLQNVAAKLRGHPLERQSNSPANENDEPTIADKVDYMLSLCNILLESQHQVSSAVQKNLHAHGVSIGHHSTHTRSMKSNVTPSRRSSRVEIEPGMPGPAPLTPLSENNLDVQPSSTTDKPESPPLPPVPDPAECEESCPNSQEESSPLEVLPPVVVQEAGLGRIENLLVALLSRMDESAQRQQSEPPPPPVPEKDSADGHLAYSRKSYIGTESQSESLNLDADVALWKSGAQSGTLSDRLSGTCNEQQQPNSFGLSVTSQSPTIPTPTEPETSSTSPDHFNQQIIPDYNLAYEAEDEVARRIADERARAARRLEGVSTPFNYRHSFGRNDLPAHLHSRVTSQSHDPAAQMIPPNQDHYDPDRPSTHGVAGFSSVSPPQPSNWSSTLPTPDDQDDTIPPSPPPKDDRIVTQAFNRPAPSTRAPSRGLSSSAVSRQSVPQSHQSCHSSTCSESLHNVSPPQPSHPQNLPQELRNVVQEVIQKHSTEQAPILDEVVTLLRTQDQVSQASVLNQAEVSRYLGQLNVHLENVLEKKNEDIHQIGENVGRLEKQLAFLAEQSEKISSALPLINAGTFAPPAPFQAPTSTDQPQDEVTNDTDGNDPLQVDPNIGLNDTPVDVSVHPNDSDPTAEADEPHVTLLSSKPSNGYKINGPRARKISFGKMGIKGPRMPAGLSSVGKLWGGPTPVADRAARWGTSSIGGGGGSLKRVPTKTSQFGGVSEHLAHVEGALSQVNPDDPVGQQVLSQMDAADDDRSGTIALGVSHILKFLRENAEKEELRRQKKEIEKANTPQPAIPDEMEKRRAKIEELQLRREATLAEDKAKHLEAMMQAMKQQAVEHDKLLKKIAEEMENKKSNNHEQEEEERKKSYQDALDGVNKVLTTVESGVLSHLEDFKAQMMNEMRQTFEKVGELREQKQQIQADIADMLAYMAKFKGGAPDPRWQQPPHLLSHNFKGGMGNEGSVAGFSHPQHLAPIPEVYPMPHTDFLERDGISEIHATRSVSGFGPRPPGPR